LVANLQECTEFDWCTHRDQLSEFPTEGAAGHKGYLCPFLDHPVRLNRHQNRQKLDFKSDRPGMALKNTAAFWARCRLCLRMRRGIL
jgi:hypothetical protein